MEELKFKDLLGPKSTKISRKMKKEMLTLK